MLLSARRWLLEMRGSVLIISSFYVAPSLLLLSAFLCHSMSETQLVCCCCCSPDEPTNGSGANDQSAIMAREKTRDSRERVQKIVEARHKLHLFVNADWRECDWPNKYNIDFYAIFPLFPSLFNHAFFSLFSLLFAFFHLSTTLISGQLIIITPAAVAAHTLTQLCNSNNNNTSFIMRRYSNSERLEQQHRHQMEQMAQLINYYYHSL